MQLSNIKNIMLLFLVLLPSSAYPSASLKHFMSMQTSQKIMDKGLIRYICPLIFGSTDTKVHATSHLRQEYKNVVHEASFLPLLANLKSNSPIAHRYPMPQNGINFTSTMYGRGVKMFGEENNVKMVMRLRKYGEILESQKDTRRQLQNETLEHTWLEIKSKEEGSLVVHKLRALVPDSVLIEAFFKSSSRRVFLSHLSQLEELALLDSRNNIDQIIKLFEILRSLSSYSDFFTPYKVQNYNRTGWVTLESKDDFEITVDQSIHYYSLEEKIETSAKFQQMFIGGILRPIAILPPSFVTIETKLPLSVNLSDKKSWSEIQKIMIKNFFNKLQRKQVSPFPVNEGKHSISKRLMDGSAT